MITLDSLQSEFHSVQIKDASGNTLAISASGEVSVIATDLDIRDLSHVSDSVKVGDGTDFLVVNADGSINVQSVPGGFASWATKTVTATNTASQIDATPLAGRLMVEIQNLGNADIYIGPSNAVTTANGLKIPKGSSQAIELDSGAQIWAITASGSADIRLAEYAA